MAAIIEEQVRIEATLDLVGLDKSMANLKKEVKGISKEINKSFKKTKVDTSGIDKMAKSMKGLQKEAIKTAKTTKAAFKPTGSTANFITTMFRDIKASFAGMLKSVGTGFKGLTARFKAGWAGLAKTSSAGTKKIAGMFKGTMFDGASSGAMKFSAALGPVALGLTVVGAAAVAATAGVAALVTPFVQTAAEFERYTTVLTVLEGSNQKAEESMSWITDFAQATPDSLQQVTDAFVKMRAYGLDPMDGSLKVWSDTAAAMGKPVIQAVEAIADAVQGENERLKEFGVKAKKEGDRLKYMWTDSSGEAAEIVIKNNKKIIDSTLQAIMSSKYAGAGDALSKTWDGIWSNIGITWTKFKKDTMADTGLFDYFKSLAQDFGKWFDDALKSIKPFTHWIANVLMGAIDSLISVLKFLGGVLDVVGAAVKGLWKIFSKALEYMKAAWDEMWKADSSFANSGVGEFLLSIKDAFIELGDMFANADFVSGIELTFKSLEIAFYEVMQALSEAVDYWYYNFDNRVKEIKNFFIGLVNAIGKLWYDMITSISKMWTEWTNSIKKGFNTAAKWVGLDFRMETSTPNLEPYVASMKEVALNTEFVSDETKYWSKNIKTANTEADVLVKKIIKGKKDSEAVTDASNKKELTAAEQRKQAEEELAKIRKEHGLDGLKGSSKAAKNAKDLNNETEAFAKKSNEILKEWERINREINGIGFDTDKFKVSIEEVDAMLTKTVADYKAALSFSPGHMKPLKMDAEILDTSASEHALQKFQEVLNNVGREFGLDTEYAKKFVAEMVLLNKHVLGVWPSLHKLSTMTNHFAQNVKKLGASSPKALKHFIDDILKLEKLGLLKKVKNIKFDVKVSTNMEDYTLGMPTKEEMAAMTKVQQEAVKEVMSFYEDAHKKREKMREEESQSIKDGLEGMFDAFADLDILSGFESIGRGIQDTIKESFKIETPMSFFKAIGQGFKAFSDSLDATIASSVWGIILTIGLEAMSKLLSGGTVSAEAMQQAEGFNEVQSESMTLALDNLTSLQEQGLLYEESMATDLRILASQADAAASNISENILQTDYVTKEDLGFFNDETRDLVFSGISIKPASIDELTNGVIKGQAYMREQVSDSGFLGIGSGTSLETTILNDDISGVLEPITQAYVASINTMKEAAATLGVSEADFAKFTESWKSALNDINLAGKTQEEAAELIKSAISEDMDNLAETLLPLVDSIDQFKYAGEGAAQTLVRLATEYKVVSQMYSQMGTTLAKVGEGGLHASQALVQAAGSMEALGDKWSYFYENFYSDTERATFQMGQMNAAFAETGLVVPQTAEEYRNLVTAETEQLNAAAALHATTLTAVEDAWVYAQSIYEVGSEQYLAAEESYNGAILYVDGLKEVEDQHAKNVNTLLTYAPVFKEIEDAAASSYSELKAFWDIFGTDEEKIAFVTQHLEGLFAAVGLALPATKEAMKAMYLEQDEKTRIAKQTWKDTKAAFEAQALVDDIAAKNAMKMAQYEIEIKKAVTEATLDMLETLGAAVNAVADLPDLEDIEMPQVPGGPISQEDVDASYAGYLDQQAITDMFNENMSALGEIFGTDEAEDAAAAEEGQTAQEFKDAVDTFAQSVLDLESQWMGQLEGAILNRSQVQQQTGITGITSENFLSAFRKEFGISHVYSRDLDKEVTMGNVDAVTGDERITDSVQSQTDVMYDGMNKQLTAAYTVGNAIISAVNANSAAVANAVASANAAAYSVGYSPMVGSCNSGVSFDSELANRELEGWRRTSDAIKRLEEAVKENTRSNEGGQYVAALRKTWGSWGQDEVTARAVAGETGISGVNADNFIEEFNKAVAKGLTVEELGLWQELSDVLQALVTDMKTFWDIFGTTEEQTKFATEQIEELFASVALGVPDDKDAFKMLYLETKAKKDNLEADYLLFAKQTNLEKRRLQGKKASLKEQMRLAKLEEDLRCGIVVDTTRFVNAISKINKDMANLDFKLNNSGSSFKALERQLDMMDSNMSEIGTYYDSLKAVVDAMQQMIVSVAQLEAQWMDSLEGAIMMLGVQENATGLSGLDYDNFLESFRVFTSSVGVENVTQEELKDWQTMSGALKTLEKAIIENTRSNEGGQYVAKIRQTWGEPGQELATVNALAKETELFGLTVDNFLTEFNKAVDDGLTAEKLKDWQAMSGAMKSLEKAIIENTRSNEGGQYVAKIRQTWGELDQNQVIADAVAKETGLLNLTVENFLDQFNKAVTDGLTVSEFKDWSEMSNALQAVWKEQLKALNLEKDFYTEVLSTIENAYLGSLSYLNSMEKAKYAERLAQDNLEEGDTQGYFDALEKQLEEEKKISRTREEYASKFNKYITELQNAPYVEDPAERSADSLEKIEGQIADLQDAIEKSSYQT